MSGSSQTPHRFYIQTPAEIIQEARETIMGIRAVPTNRPFTPKERERILFGSTRKGTRPPSAVNLSYLQKENARVKLPSIVLPSRPRQRATTTKAVLSLDNLVEDAEGELFALNAATVDDLPGTRKSYSCPQERTQSAFSKEQCTRAKEAWTSNQNLLSSSLDNSISQKKKKIYRLKSLSVDNSLKEFQDFVEPPLPVEMPTANYVEPTSENKTANENDQQHEDLVAVLSEGKLVWEQRPEVKMNNKDAQTHLDEMKTNLNHVQNRMSILHDKIEKLGNRNAVNEQQTFEMNTKTRHHPGKETKQPKEKAYRRWTEKQQQSDQEEPVKKVESVGWDFFWKNTYFRPKEEKIDPAIEYLQDIVEALKIHRAEDGNILEAENKLNSLYISLKSGDYFNNNALPAAFKTKLLQTLYLYADDESPVLLLHIARLILAIRMSSSLPAACKMIFKVTRSDANDYLFIEMDDVLELFLDGIGRASPLEATESCIYAYGALKFLTMNHLLLSRLLHIGALDLVTLHLKIINDAALQGCQVEEQTKNALFQLTGTLRNIAAGEGVTSIFVTTNCIPTVCKTLQLFRKDEEIVTNISRTLSLVSTEEDITRVLLSIENILILLVDLMQQYKLHDQIVIRLSYTLGNILAVSDMARIQMSRSERCVPTLVELLELYIDKDGVRTEREEDNDEVWGEVLVKVIRVLANMSMNPIVGSNLSPASQDKTALHLLKLLSELLKNKSPGSILLATLGCLNNISYYINSHSGLTELSQGIVRILSLAPNECIVEAARVLGNLTRHKNSRDVVFEMSGLEIIQKLLKTEDRETTHCICGVLVNMLLDSQTRAEFLSRRGIDVLLDTTERFPADWPLAGLICRAIWNACADHINTAIENNDMTRLLTTLANYLEEDSSKENDTEWEEFAVIATDLLERFNSYLEAT